jgi:type I restriction enzyme S subunit
MSASHWQPTPLADVLQKNNKRVPLVADDDYKQITVRLWGKGLALRGVCKGAEIAASEQIGVEAGQFIISKIDARHGAFGLVPPELDGAVVSGDFPCFDVNAKRMLPRFLLWLSRTEQFVSLCRGASEGSTNRVRLKEATLLASQVALPLLSEQHRIVARLDGINEKINEYRKLSAGQISEIGAWVEASHKEASGTRCVRLSEVLKLDEDKVHVKPKSEYPQVGIRGFARGMFKKESVLSGHTQYRHFNRLYDGAFVVSQVKGWEGAVAVCGRNFSGLFVSPEYRTFQCQQDGILPSYLDFISQTSWFLEGLSRLTRGQGARRERLRPEMLLEWVVPMPTVVKQAKLVEAFSRASMIGSHRKTIARDVEALLPALLSQVFG